MKYVLVTIGFLMIAATVLPLLRKDSWWIRILDFPRLQITVLIALALIAYWWLGVSPDAAGHLFLAALLSCLLYQSYRMYPYTVFSRQQCSCAPAHPPS